MSYLRLVVNLALIGNCGYQALIDDRARVKWLCWPRFDSSFVFGELIDSQHGGEFSIAPRDGAFETQQSYIPNTNILKTRFRTEDAEFEVTDFAPRFRQYERFYKPSMLVRRVRPVAGRPVIRVVCRPVYDYGRSVPPDQPASNHIHWQLPDAQLRLTTNASLSFIHEARPFALEGDVYLVLTWGQPLEAPLIETCDNFYRRTRRYWETWVKHGALPDKFQAEVIRSALTLKLHQFEDTGAITAATTTSLPEHPGSGRNWDYRYCWLRDACFTLGALRRLGQFEEMERFVGYLTNIAEESKDKLQPVYGITGERNLHEITLDHLAGFQGNGPVRAGNAAYMQTQHDVYGEMIAAIAPLFLDLRFQDVAQARSPKLLHHLLARIDETLLEPDVGLWEKRDQARLHTFSLLMHWTGAHAAMRVGVSSGDSVLEDTARLLAKRARDVIESRCWRADKGFFADAVDTDEADASLLLLVNLGFLPAGDQRALSHVLETAKRLAAQDHLLFRYLHHDGIGDTKSSFTVCGFWYAEALARLGRTEQAEEVFLDLVAHANHVGLLSEDIDPQTGKLWGNFPQTYSHVGLINAAFAISPVTGPMI
jgi:GH15 family glucan-1,4-alpha-glucosidase